MSQRRVCRVLDHPRSTQRYEPVVADDDLLLRAGIVELASEYGRYGYRRITALLHQEGWQVNPKQVERIWRQDDLRVPKKQPKRGRLWLNDGYCMRLRPHLLNHVWSYDFVASRTHADTPRRMLTVLDEYGWACFAFVVARRLNSDDVVSCLARLMTAHGTPEHIPSDNGLEITAAKAREWLGALEVGTSYIESGSPWNNGNNESFNAKLRDELLNGEIFYNL